MRHWKPWPVPVSLAAAQLAIWPGLPLLRDQSVPTPQLAIADAAVLVITAALMRRRQAPVTVAVVVSVSLALSGWAWTLTQPLARSADDLLVIGLADLIALFSVAVHRSVRTALATAGSMLGIEAVGIAVIDGLNSGYPANVGFIAGLYIVLLTLGRIRNRWHADRAEAARLLAAAQQTHRDAADAERGRLARELHDVTAHHLTSIVVNASAAQFIGEQRPELRAEALDFAAKTGWDTLAALRRLVAILPVDSGSEATTVPTLSELATDFGRLGQQVTLDLPIGEPPPELAAAVHGIAREALTNTLRYAPGTKVHLHFAYATSSALSAGNPRGASDLLSPAGPFDAAGSYGIVGARLVIEDDGPAGSSAVAAGLGSGRGVLGMRERAASLGGTLTAGPRPTRGWQVHATFQPDDPTPTGSMRRWQRSEVVLDVILAVLVLVLPAAVLADQLEAGLAPTLATVSILAQLAHIVPLLWRRVYPWQVLFVVMGTAWLGPVVLATRTATGDLGWAFVLAPMADMAAVYAVAAYRGPASRSWPAPVAALCSAALTLGVLGSFTVTDGDSTEIHGPLTNLLLILVAAAPMAMALTVPMVGCWLAGNAAGQRRLRRRETEVQDVAVTMARAAVRVRAERDRVAAGLRDAVLTHAAGVPAAAERADLDGVLAAARQALGAMRALLDGLGTAAVAPAPTLATLAERLLSSGCETTVELAAGEVTAAADVAACRMVELLLSGTAGPASVLVNAEGDMLRLVVWGAPIPRGGEMRARIAALGGRLLVRPDRILVVRLSNSAQQEVPSSPSE